MGNSGDSRRHILAFALSWVCPGITVPFLPTLNHAADFKRLDRRRTYSQLPALFRYDIPAQNKKGPKKALSYFKCPMIRRHAPFIRVLYAYYLVPATAEPTLSKATLLLYGVSSDQFQYLLLLYLLRNQLRPFRPAKYK